MKLLLFAGAGTSVELGVPAMAGMAREFLAHSQQWDVEPRLVQDLLGKVMDVEHLIEDLDRISSARTPLEAIGNLATSFDTIDKIRAEVEWFVQHTAERLTAADAQLMWSSVLRLTQQHEIIFVTTNYDRAIELAANAQDVRVDDGYSPFGQMEWSAWEGFDATSGQARLIKLHGSTDWFADQSTGHPLKLRHPMPLFGRGTLHLGDGEALGSALVLPSREKMLTKPPYPRLSQAFLNATDSCELGIFVGTSLRDYHVRDAVASIARSKPVFIVNPKGDSHGIENVQVIAQPASTFLTSTLPCALTSVAPHERLARISRLPIRRTDGVHVLLRQALDVNESTARRCDAIERLDEEAVTLDDSFLKKLLSDADGTVSRYALGLLSVSPSRDGLLIAARESPHAEDVLFAEELELVEKMILSGNEK